MQKQKYSPVEKMSVPAAKKYYDTLDQRITDAGYPHRGKFFVDAEIAAPTFYYYRKQNKKLPEEIMRQIDKILNSIGAGKYTDMATDMAPLATGEPRDLVKIKAKSKICASCMDAALNANDTPCCRCRVLSQVQPVSYFVDTEVSTQEATPDQAGKPKKEANILPAGISAQDLIKLDAQAHYTLGICSGGEKDLTVRKLQIVINSLQNYINIINGRE